MRALLTGNTYFPLPTTADSLSPASGNLRAAIAAANVDTGSSTDTIDLASGTYTLTQGELEISGTAHALIIHGQGSTGPNATIIDQLSLARVFQVDAGVTVKFEDIEITGGTAEPTNTSELVEGGGILSSGNPYPDRHRRDRQQGHRHQWRIGVGGAAYMPIPAA